MNPTAKLRVREITPNILRSKSLEETAKERLDLISDINIKNCNFVFEDYYTSLLELLQSKLLKILRN